MRTLVSDSFLLLLLRVSLAAKYENGKPLSRSIHFRYGSCCSGHGFAHFPGRDYFCTGAQGEGIGYRLIQRFYFDLHGDTMIALFAQHVIITTQTVASGW